MILHGLPCSNLRGNNFTRPLPAKLLEKSKKGSLLLSIESISDEDISSCLEGSCNKKEGNKKNESCYSSASNNWCCRRAINRSSNRMDH
ncbi:hypothetical protein HanXRQr2_Chr03g0090521 [Helianthus annuus]|uniref:Uncharacterized protein n=1 Tax=Helianthus annuus TaxID=4232 RepID=A0A9K3NU61_HELAN|nr:hypothetical protein HanXRQr2_Chr03g0090521 [Helianthus annuus]